MNENNPEIYKIVKENVIEKDKSNLPTGMTETKIEEEENKKRQKKIAQKQKLIKINKIITENLEGKVTKIENNMQGHIKTFESLKDKVNLLIKENADE